MSLPRMTKKQMAEAARKLVGVAMTERRDTPNGEARLGVHLVADSGFEHLSQHRITLDQWAAINAILNGETGVQSETALIPPEVEARVLQEAIEYLHLRGQHEAALMLKHSRHQLLKETANVTKPA